jgi:hypothetical protein
VNGQKELPKQEVKEGHNGKGEILCEGNQVPNLASSIRGSAWPSSFV